MRLLSAAIVAALVLAAGSAQAAIRITASRYESDTLIVRGQTRPNQTVTLDKKYKTKSDGVGHFEFRVRSYKPRYCMSDIVVGADSYSAVIAGCFLSDAAAKRRAPAKQPAKTQ
jgi:hypothetical protein